MCLLSQNVLWRDIVEINCKVFIIRGTGFNWLLGMIRWVQILLQANRLDGARQNFFGAIKMWTGGGGT